MTIHPIDLSLIAIYFVVVIVLGFWKKSGSSSEDFLLMGRRLTLPAFVMTLVSSWYGGILGISEFSYSNGLSNWVIFGLPYYVFGIVFALMFASFARRSKVTSIPHLFQKHYDEQSGKIASIWVLLLASPAPYVLTLGLLLNYFFMIPLPLAIVIGGLLSIVYITWGGFQSVVRTDMLQFGFMFIGFFTLIAITMQKYGSPLLLLTELPDTHTSFTGGHGIAFVAVWFFIASWTLVDPGFHQRIYAAKDEGTAKKGILIAIVFWFFFDIMTTLTGLYAFVIIPGNIMPSQAFLHLGSLILPIGLQGIFFIGIISTVMSTLDSNALVSGLTLGHDIFPEYLNAPNRSSRWLVNLGILLTMIVAIILAILLPSVIALWYTFGTMAIPALLFPVLLALSGRNISPVAIKLNLTLSPLTALSWYLFARIDEWTYVWNIEPFYPGMTVSILILMLFRKTKRNSKEMT